MLDFMVLQVIGLTIVFLFPQVALWLPEKLFGLVQRRIRLFPVHCRA